MEEIMGIGIGKIERKKTGEGESGVEKSSD